MLWIQLPIPAHYQLMFTRWRIQLTNDSTPQHLAFAQGSSPDTPIRGGTIMLTTTGGGTMITTTLTLTSSAELNGSIFTCSGVAGADGNQTATVMVFGMLYYLLVWHVQNIVADSANFVFMGCSNVNSSPLQHTPEHNSSLFDTSGSLLQHLDLRGA